MSLSKQPESSSSVLQLVSSGRESAQNVSTGKRIKEVRFGLLGSEDMCKVAELECINTELYQLRPERVPARQGCLDTRLGAVNKTGLCSTCKLRVEQCSGHFGVVRLALPVFHAGFLSQVLTLLQCVCKQCSRVLMEPVVREAYVKKMKFARDALTRSSIFKKITEKCKATGGVCPYCGAQNGPVKKIAGAGALKAIHEKWRGFTSGTKLTIDNDEYRAFAVAVEGAAKKAWTSMTETCTNEEDDEDKNYGGLMEYLSPVEVRRIFERMTDSDCRLLWTEPELGRPEHLVLSSLLIPPTSIRPSVQVDTPGGGGSNEDDLTVKLQEIIEVNAALENALSQGGSVEMVVHTWNFLQVQVALYINGELASSLMKRGLPSERGGGKPIRGLCQRLKGKSGRFRGNLSGKRVDFSGRTVISPDPNLRIDQVGVPRHVAKILSYPERVTALNLDHMKTLVKNGPHRHPGANYVEFSAETNTTPLIKKSLQYGDRSKIAQGLKPGDLVERHVTDGDIVLFNRQPSLHKLSIMAHRVKVMPWRTFRFNECVCAPYNADFDGDEMNLHLPQTEEAKAEAAVLMPSQANVSTPRNGEPLIAATQDFLTASFLLTQRDVFFKKETFCSLAAYAGDAKERIELPVPAILKPQQLWTGKQLFSLLIRPNADPLSIADDDDDNFLVRGMSSALMEGDRVGPLKAKHPKKWPHVSFQLAERNYSGSNFELCPNDGYVHMRRSVLISGNIAKSTIGQGSKRGLVYTLYKDHGAAAAAACMNRIAKLSARYLGYHRGFSIGIGDVTPSIALNILKQREIDQGNASASEQIQLYKDNRLPLKPGCDPLQSLEAELTGLLGKVREKCGKLAMKTLPSSNAPRLMAESGAKGSALNVSQMTACLGQQAVDGKRVADGFNKRTLPHFHLEALEPAAKGFVQNSFFSGLTATEFFFHTMGGREGLVDTAVKSVAWETPIYLLDNNVLRYTSIGAYIDQELLRDASAVQYTPHDRNLESLAVRHRLLIPSTNAQGILTWAQVTALTRHDPGDSLFTVRTLSGRTVTVTSSKSLLVYRSGRLIPVRPKELQTGDKVPVNMHLPTFTSERGAPSYIDWGNMVRLRASSFNDGRFAGICLARSSSSSSLPAENDTFLNECFSRYGVSRTQANRLLKEVDFDEILLTASDDFAKGVITGFFSLDSTKKKCLCVKTASRRLLHGITFLCNRLGIFTRLHGLEISIEAFFESKIDTLNDVALDPIIEIKAINCLEHKKMYDLTVPSTLNFGLADGLQVRDTAQTGYMARRLMKALEDLSVQYDGTVRNSESNIVQLVYGDDGLDPCKMEANDGPVDLDRLLFRLASGDTPPTENDDHVITNSDGFLEPEDTLALKHSYAGTTTPAERFRADILEFMQKHALDPDTAHKFAQLATWKYSRTLVEAGEAVGAVGAQCISEPGTQMTLKTFHFAGVASMNVTLGVPRLTEIINASKQISTPIITAALDNSVNPGAAKVVKARLEKTTLGEVCKELRQIIDPRKGPCLEVVLDLELIAELDLNVSIQTARSAVINAKMQSKCPPILRSLTPEQLAVKGGPNIDTFRVLLPTCDPGKATGTHAWKPGNYYSSSGSSSSNTSNAKKQLDPGRLRGDDPTLFALHALKEALPGVVVTGIPSVNRVVVNSENDEKYHLLVEGYGLERVMGTEGVDGRKTTTNHVHELEAVLGIEAARATISSEIFYIMHAYGISIDRRHLALLSDVMTFKGLVLGITRFGVSKMRESVLMLASFERTTDHLFDAAVHGRSDKIVGVSECIIMGIPIPLGTGSFKILQDDSALPSSKKGTVSQLKKKSPFRKKRQLIMNLYG